jgi:uncharacterized protein
MLPNPHRFLTRSAIPLAAGVGLRAQHYHDVLASQPAVGWFEVHSENYFGKGGAPLHFLERIRADYPISLHGVGMSLGSTDALDRQHIASLKALIGRIEPGLVSEHLSWSSVGGDFLNDLVPVPYTEAALDHFATKVSQTQDELGRWLLIENPSSYLEYKHAEMPEWVFLNELCRRTGCGILLDINNVYVSCCNHGWDALAYLQGITVNRVGEFHLAGHTMNKVGNKDVLIDTHNRPVCMEVWNLFKTAIGLIGPKPTLIEWDTDIPPFSVLMDEAERADAIMEVGHVSTG